MIEGSVNVAALERDGLILSLERKVRVAAKHAWRLMPIQMPLDDLISEGWIGAIWAVDHWKPERGFQLSTYAEHRIRGAIQDYMRRLDFIGRQARQIHKKAVRLAEAAGAVLPDVPARFTSIDARTMRTAGTRDPRFGCIDNEADVAAMNKKAKLSWRESEVIRRVFGLEHTAVSIAKDFRCHETLIFQIKVAALAKLRTAP